MGSPHPLEPPMGRPEDEQLREQLGELLFAIDFTQELPTPPGGEEEDIFDWLEHGSVTMRSQPHVSPPQQRREEMGTPGKALKLSRIANTANLLVYTEIPGYSDEWRDSFVLACGASPANAAALQLAQEFTVTKKAIREVSDVYSLWHNTERAFLDRDWSTVNSLADDLIKYRPLVLHISSHASEFAVNLAEDSANSEHSPLSMEALKNLVTTSRESSIPYPEVIVLNCCYTETMAMELANIRTSSSPNNGPFVIGTKLPKVHDNKAVDFAVKFYRLLAKGYSLREAFDSAQGASHFAGMYFLDTGGRAAGDIDVASNYYVPPTDYRIIPIATGYKPQRELYRTLVNTARRPLTFGRYDFTSQATGNHVVASGMEFELARLPRVASEEIAGFHGEADRLLEQDPRPSVPGSGNYARYFVNHLRAITGDNSHGPCLFAWYQGEVYYEEQGAWLKYRATDNFRLLNEGMDPVRWKERFPFEW